MQQRPQGGAGSLVLALRIGGSLIPKQVGSEVLFRTHAGATALHYGQLSVLDATGRLLPAVMQIRNGTLQLRIDDSNARYPLRIDPFIQQGEKLVGNCTSSCSGPNGTGEIGHGEFGSGVALSGDGNTALIGGCCDNSGAGAGGSSRARDRPGPRVKSSRAAARSEKATSATAWPCPRTATPR